ncbi:hypothetical protein [Streptacidiphilus sp. EB129]|uniref:hypothetical protein n=1 Tax=Streptacidiphilus sp. EB129 TaxID=3156262 RepID=UPI0035133B50
MGSKDIPPERRGLEWDGPQRGRRTSSGRRPSGTSASGTSASGRGHETASRKTAARSYPKPSAKRAPAPGKRPRISCGGLFGAFLLLLVFVIGTVALVNGSRDLGYQAGLRGGAPLRMTVESCQTHQSGKSRITECYGQGDPGRSGVVDWGWTIQDASSSYAPGTVVPVRCSQGGTCEETGAGAVGEDIAATALGLLLLSAGLLGVVTLGGAWLLPGRLDLGNSRWLKLTGAWWFGGLAVVVLGGMITYFAA